MTMASKRWPSRLRDEAASCDLSDIAVVDVINVFVVDDVDAIDDEVERIILFISNQPIQMTGPSSGTYPCRQSKMPTERN